jgi:hypothetical protein
MFQTKAALLFKELKIAHKGNHAIPSTGQAGLLATGEIRQNIKFVAFWCVFLTKIKVDPESW